MWPFPSKYPSKTRCSPSGDQRGGPISGPPKEVICTAFEPLRSLSQISRLPERLDKNEILFPSGENWGPDSPRVEAIQALPLAAPSGPGTSIRQMLESPNPCE